MTDMDKWLIRNKDRNNNPASDGPGTPASSTTSHSSVEHSTDTSSLPVASDSTVKGAHSTSSTGTESDSVPLKRLKVDKVHKFQTDCLFVYIIKNLKTIRFFCVKYMPP